MEGKTVSVKRKRCIYGIQPTQAHAGKIRVQLDHRISIASFAIQGHVYDFSIEQAASEKLKHTRLTPVCMQRQKVNKVDPKIRFESGG